MITGASGSMGAAAVRSVASRGGRVIMACRNLSKAGSVRESVIRDIPGAVIDIAELDLSSLASVRKFAEGLSGERVDALFNNAGVINRDYRLTPDGMENTLATNYAGPFLLTGLLLPRMEDGSRVVDMVSLTCRYGNVDRTFFDRGEDRFSQLGTYSDTKLALLLSGIAFARRYGGIRFNFADPGIVNSNMISMGRWFDPLADVFFRPLCKRPEKGVSPALKALDSEACLHYFAGRFCHPVSDRYVSHPFIDWLFGETARRVGLNDV